MKPFFSIVIPTLNEEEYLPKLLQSLVCQTYKDFEVIVADGMSEDETIEMANRFLDKLNICVVNCGVRHQTVQRNMGAARSVGECLVFFDADVEAPQNYLSEARNYIIKNKPKLMTTWLRPDSDNLLVKVAFDLGNVWVDLRRKSNKPYLYGVVIFMSRNLFEEINGFDEKLKMSEDHDLASRCAKLGVELHLLYSPRLMSSIRRIRREGVLSVLVKYVICILFIIFNKPITEEALSKLYDYQMGGGFGSTKATKKRIMIRNFIHMIKTDWF